MGPPKYSGKEPYKRRHRTHKDLLTRSAKMSTFGIWLFVHQCLLATNVAIVLNQGDYNLCKHLPSHGIQLLEACATACCQKSEIILYRTGSIASSRRKQYCKPSQRVSIDRLLFPLVIYQNFDILHWQYQS